MIIRVRDTTVRFRGTRRHLQAGEVEMIVLNTSKCMRTGLFMIVSVFFRIFKIRAIYLKRFVFTAI